jgi:hypothetical protein
MMICEKPRRPVSEHSFALTMQTIPERNDVGDADSP